jgi:hypothetical protein
MRIRFLNGASAEVEQPYEVLLQKLGLELYAPSQLVIEGEYGYVIPLEEVSLKDAVESFSTVPASCKKELLTMFFQRLIDQKLVILFQQTYFGEDYCYEVYAKAETDPDTNVAERIAPVVYRNSIVEGEHWVSIVGEEYAIQLRTEEDDIAQSFWQLIKGCDSRFGKGNTN